MYAGDYRCPPLMVFKQTLRGAMDEWGNKGVLGLTCGFRESTQSWRELLLDLKRRGLDVAPKLAVGDGTMG